MLNVAQLAAKTIVSTVQAAFWKCLKPLYLALGHLLLCSLTGHRYPAGCAAASAVQHVVSIQVHVHNQDR